MLMTTDTYLVRRAVQGDRDAFDAVFDATFARVFAFAGRRASDRGAAEELTKRILVRVFASLDRYQGEVPFAAWLLEVAKETARDSRRGLQRARPRSPFAHRPAS